MSAHTPGPWHIAGINKKFVYALNEQGYNRFDACVQRGNVAPMEWTTDEELEANARLIAAAPEILTWFRLFITRVPDAYKFTWQYEQAIATIAKATGSAA